MVLLCFLSIAHGVCSGDGQGESPNCAASPVHVSCTEAHLLLHRVRMFFSVVRKWLLPLYFCSEITKDNDECFTCACMHSGVSKNKLLSAGQKKIIWIVKTVFCESTLALSVHIYPDIIFSISFLPHLVFRISPAEL